MSPSDDLSVEVQPLLKALQELSVAYDEAQQRAEALLRALASNDFAAVKEAVADQRSTLDIIERAERRRCTAETALAGALARRGLVPAEAAGRLNSSTLLAALPPDDASALRALRQGLLSRLVGLQSTYRQATMLVHSAQAVLKRAVRYSVQPSGGYTARGDPTPPAYDRLRQSARWA
ncbi:MAG TPA: flagellar export chaperone FlgN [Chloroflexota bacterium]|nr:flagellar export chaperone FlgN [Chloroflexota bacterium]